jgi:hypothetical protein
MDRYNHSMNLAEPPALYLPRAALSAHRSPKQSIRHLADRSKIPLRLPEFHLNYQAQNLLLRMNLLQQKANMP